LVKLFVSATILSAPKSKTKGKRKMLNIRAKCQQNWREFMNIRIYRKEIFAGVALLGLAAIFLFVNGKAKVEAQKLAPEGISSIIYSNGQITTGATTRSGVAAPASTNWSEVSYDFGSTTETNTTLGFGCQRIGTVTNNRCADDFTVPVGQTWTVGSVVTYAYQTGFAGATSPVVAANVQIWNGRPGDAGASVIAGNNTSMPFTSTDASIFRTSNSGPPLNTVPGTTRRVWENTITVSPSAVLTAGTYWVDFQTDTGATTGNFTPPVTITGIRTHPTWNGRQFTAAWADALDAGNPAAAIDVPQEFSFKLSGSVSGAPAIPRSRSLDFNGDNKSDFVVARASGATAQSSWLILNSAGGVSGIDWGLGVGFATGDKATPADFDGDGKTDVAVWRPGSATVAAFYVLNSAGNTVSIIPFGQTGDDPSIVGDYDGDGKADPSVHRPGNNTFYYRGSLNNPGGNVSFVPFGVSGDFAVPGDFDGDGKYDFNIARNSGGQITHWQLRSGGGVVTFPYGLSTDKLSSGDYDGDGRADIAAVRANAGVWDWYVLKSSTLQTVGFSFGNSAVDYLVPSDYDGDGKTDFAVWRSEVGANNGYFYVLNSLSSPQNVRWGQSAGSLSPPDYPIANFRVK
jgi:hypothetical protein